MEQTKTKPKKDFAPVAQSSVPENTLSYLRASARPGICKGIRTSSHAPFPLVVDTGSAVVGLPVSVCLVKSQLETVLLMDLRLHKVRSFRIDN